MILDTKSVFLGFFKLFFLINLISCAKISYVLDQGVGQLRIINKAKLNAEVLADAKISAADKEKIKKIALYKNFFYDYYQQKTSAIYDKTYFLKDRAVSYLVISSKKDEIKAGEECFPIMGCFPYLGYYKQADAKSYAKSLEEEKGMSTFIRPVYAYSTLGYFTDPILSSFFVYSEYELAELIFHELFHTIFFIKGEVELNENLANYFGRQLSIEYFKLNPTEVEKWEKEDQMDHDLNSFILKKISVLNGYYSKSGGGEEKHLQRFLEVEFYPELKSLCESQKRSCVSLLSPWNNARFAAYLTYEKQSEEIKGLHQKSLLSLKDFYAYIEKKYQDFKSQSKIKKFSQFLLGEKTL